MTLHTHDIYRERRRALAARHPGVLFVLHAPDAGLSWLTGLDEASACLVLGPDGAGGYRELLYLRPGAALAELWEGPRMGFGEAAAISGVGDVRALTRLEDELADRVAAAEAVGYRLGVDGQRDAGFVAALVQGARRRLESAPEVAAMAPAHRRMGRGLAAVRDPGPLVAEGSLVKSEVELEAMRRAAQATARAHEVVMGLARPGQSGLELAARFEAALFEGGCEQKAFDTIVAIGAEATCLHATPSSRRASEGEVVLVDGGGRVEGYVADLSRSWPVGSSFSAEAGALYDLVLAAEQAAIEAVRPGATLDAVHEAAAQVLEGGLGSLGLVGGLERWFPHATSHWIGLDVHDGGARYLHGLPRPLEVGMVFTIEPGLYVPADAADAPEALRGLGVRIEDTVAVVEGGAEVLTAGAPRRREAIEAMRARALLSG